MILGFESGTRYTPPPSAEAWRIGPEDEQTHELHDPLTVTGITGTDHQGEPCPVVMRGGYPAADRDWRLVRDLIRRHALRICPWGTLWCAPTIDGIEQRVGMAWRSAAVAVVRTDTDASTTLDTAWHKLWHLLEQWTPPDTLDAALAAGPAYSRNPGSGRHYLALPQERRARAFAHVAMLAVEGLPLPPPGFLRTDPWGILRRAWDGDLSRESAERREAALAAERHRIAGRTVRMMRAA